MAQKVKVDLSRISGLALNPDGLGTEEIAKQTKLFGPNSIVDSTPNPWIELLAETIKDPMLWLLLVVGTLFAAVGEYVDAGTLFAAIVPLFFMDAYLHFKTQNSAKTLRDQLRPSALVIREGRETVIEASTIVPGDLIVLKTGDVIPADGYFESASEIQMDESILTGEAFAVKKNAFVFANKSTDLPIELLVDPIHLGYAGTRALVGSGRLRISATGAQTMYGGIVRSIASIPRERTPLQKSIDSLMRYLVIIAAVFCAVLAVARLAQGKGWIDAIVSAATLAVAAIPEEFPIVFSFFLGVGAFRLAKKKALVRRAVTVENIGRVTRICTDKTGTITLGELRLAHYDLPASANTSAILNLALMASNEASADPVDVAIAKAAQDAHIKESVRQKVFPFTEERKRQAAFFQNEGALNFCALKGAPETILSRCALTSEEKAGWLLKTSKWASEGHKVLGCASKALTAIEQQNGDEPETGFEFSGLLIFEDPPRPEVKNAIQYCNENNIHVLMLTGDHPETATAIAHDIGLGGNSAHIISAEEHPEVFTHEFIFQFPDKIKKLHVAARCNPLQKLWIVESLRKAGDIVAVTGDGVNDVPALKAADIGIAMGLRGSQSAKEVASIILTDDNFDSLVSAIREGRQLFANLKISFQYLLLFHIPLVSTAALLPLLGFPLIYLPIHTIWLELIIHPTALFAFQNHAGKNVGTQSSSFFSKSDLIRIAFIGGIFSLVLAVMYVSALKESGGVDHARSMAIALLTFWSAIVVIRLTRLNTLGAKMTVFGTMGLSILLIQVPSLAPFLHVSTLHTQDMMLIILISALFLIFIRFLKIRGDH